MAYCAIDDLKSRVPEKTLIELTDDDNAGIINSLRVNSAIADADSLIDLYISEIYIVPLNPVPGCIMKISADIALYFIYTGRYDNVAPADIRLRYKEAIALLKNFKNVELTIPAAELQPGAYNRILASKKESEMVFSEDKLDNM